MLGYWASAERYLLNLGPRYLGPRYLLALLAVSITCSTACCQRPQRLWTIASLSTGLNPFATLNLPPSNQCSSDPLSPKMIAFSRTFLRADMVRAVVGMKREKLSPASLALVVEREAEMLRWRTGSA